MPDICYIKVEDKNPKAEDKNPKVVEDKKNLKLRIKILWIGNVWQPIKLCRLRVNFQGEDFRKRRSARLASRYEIRY